MDIIFISDFEPQLIEIKVGINENVTELTIENYEETIYLLERWARLNIFNNIEIAMETTLMNDHFIDFYDNSVTNIRRWIIGNIIESLTANSNLLNSDNIFYIILLLLEIL